MFDVPDPSTATDWQEWGRQLIWGIETSFRDTPLNNAGGPVWSSAPIRTTAATYTVTATDYSITFNGSAGQTVTLPTPAASAGRWLVVRTIAAFAVASASANVVPLAGGAAGTALLAATAGKWAVLHCDGTAWQVMMAN